MSLDNATLEKLARDETVLVTPTIPVQSARLIIAALATLAKDGWQALEETRGTKAGEGNDHTMNLIAVTIFEIASAGARALEGFENGITQYGIEAYAGPEVTRDLERRRDNFRTPEARQALYDSRSAVVNDAFNEIQGNPLDELLAALGIKASDLN